MKYPFPPAAGSTVPVVGSSERFPVRRIYCLARNHAEHAQEMGFSGRESPFFFLKPADAEALVVAEAGQRVAMRYPTLTQKFHHEIELVVALGSPGQNISAADAHRLIYGYAVGLDMTRQDLLDDMARQGRPWCIGKSFDQCAVIGPLTPAAQASDIENAEILLQVNGAVRQRSTVSRLIWNVGKIIEQLSQAWALRAGDLIYTGTPDGVAAVARADALEATITGLETLRVHVTP